MEGLPWSLSNTRHCHVTLEFPVGVGALQQEQVLPQALLSGRHNTICYSTFYRQEFTYIQKVGKRVSFLPWSSHNKKRYIARIFIEIYHSGKCSIKTDSYFFNFFPGKKSVYIPLHKIL